jgi:hypothetical protein
MNEVPYSAITHSTHMTSSCEKPILHKYIPFHFTGILYMCFKNGHVCDLMHVAGRVVRSMNIGQG